MQISVPRGIELAEALPTILAEEVVPSRLVVAPMPGSTLHTLDPIVVYGDSDVPPYVSFPLHPHREIEIVTYLLSGAMQHADGLGHDGVLLTGGAGRTFTGRGVMHADAPLPGEPVRALQLWLGVPNNERNAAPEFQLEAPEALPVVARPGAQIRVIVGELDGARSPLALHTPSIYLDVRLEAGREVTLPVPKDYAGLAYVVEGSGRFGEATVAGGPHHRLVLGAGDTLSAVADEQGPLRFLLVGGRPHRSQNKD